MEWTRPAASSPARVPIQPQQRREAWPGPPESLAEQLSDPWLALSTGERGEEVPGESGELLTSRFYIGAGDARNLPTPLALAIIALAATALQLATL